MSNRDLVGIRIDPHVKVALERRIITHWLQAHGWLNNEKPDVAVIRSRLVALLGP